MFIDFFYYLRKRGVKVSIGEWMVLLEGMKKGLHESTLEGFYRLCRAVILKDESEYDLFDLAFEDYFRDMPKTELFPKEWTEMLEKADPVLEVLSRRIRRRLSRMPGAPGKGRNAPDRVAPAAGARPSSHLEQTFPDFRKDNTLDTRQFQMAFRVLRNLYTAGDQRAGI